MRLLGGQRAAHLVAVQLRQVAVENHDVVGIDAGLVERGRPVAGDVDSHPLTAQPAGDGGGNSGFVLGDQDSHDSQTRFAASRDPERRLCGYDESIASLESMQEIEDPRAGLEGALYELKRVIVGQDAMLERLLVALLAGGHVLLEGVPGLAKTLTVKTLSDVLGGSVPPRPVHPRPGPVGPRGHAHLSPGHGPVRHRARPGVRQLPARRRDQPRAGQGAVRPAGGHAGAPGDDRRAPATRCPSRSS